jgi:hypothetical protein
MKMRIRVWTFSVIILIGLLFLHGQALAQCRPGDTLIDEDENYYYCASLVSSGDLEELIDKLKEMVNKMEETIHNMIRNNPDKYNPLLGEEWRFRKRVIDTVGAVIREGKRIYAWGAKITIDANGKITTICFNKGCKGKDNAVDCSGLVAHGLSSGLSSVCLVRGFYQAACVDIEPLWDKSADGMAKVFKDHNAFTPKDGTPYPGDVIFFKTKSFINHVGIYLGQTRDGRRLMMHADGYRNKKVLFEKRIPAHLQGKEVGYGNISALYMAVKKSRP